MIHFYMQFPIYFVGPNLPLEIQANVLNFARSMNNSKFYHFYKRKETISIYYLSGTESFKNQPTSNS